MYYSGKSNVKKIIYIMAAVVAVAQEEKLFDLVTGDHFDWITV